MWEQHLSPSTLSNASQTAIRWGTLGTHYIQKPNSRISAPESHTFDPWEAGHGHLGFADLGNTG